MNDDRAAVSIRWPELIVALILAALAVLVIVDSVRVGTGWADDGPRAGYFPFYIGLLLLGASGWTIVTTLLRWRRLDQPFVMRSEFSSVWAMLWPTIVFALLIPLVGIYASAILLIGWFMRVHGKYGWLPSLGVSVGAALAFFIVFERWFLVPLPKGPVEQLLGFDMQELANLAQGFAVAMTLPNLGFMLIGITLGVLIGVLPGLGGANGIAILLPLTFSMNPTSAIIMLSCIYWGALFGGAITSILFNIPGEPWSVATTFDGYPMAQQGRAAQALAAAFTSSFIGALFAVLLITFTAPFLAIFALKFGPAEFFAVQLLTFCSFIGMSREPIAKTLAAMMLGFALAAVGMDSVTGQLRMTFGAPALLKGFDFLIAVIGLFGIGEILLTMEEGLAFKGKSAKIDFRVVIQTWVKLLRYWKTFLRSVAVGCWMGITPGGATPASFMSYGIARRMSKEPESFGHGNVEGVVAPETAAHAAGTAALLPMLTLGIPGSPTAAVLLGGLMIWGLQPGPMLFVEHKDFVWGLIASMYLGNLAGLIVVLTTVPFWAALLRIPFSVIAPLIVVICAIGAYTVHSSMFDVAMMLVFGVAGYLFKKLRYPLAPLVLALVLGDMAESSFRQSMLLSQGSLAIFWSNPLVGSIAALALLLVVWPLIGVVRTRLRPAGSALKTKETG